MENMNLRIQPHFLMWPQCGYIIRICIMFILREYIRNQKGGGCSEPIENLRDDQRRDR